MSYWHTFCGHGENFTTWTAGDFGRCFEQIVVIYPTHVILTLFCAYYISQSKVNSYGFRFRVPWFIRIRLIAVLFLTLIAVIQVVATKVVGKFGVSYSDIVQSCIVAFCWLLHVFYVHRLRFIYFKTWRGSVSVVIIYMLTVISQGAQLHTSILQRKNSSKLHNIIEEICVYIATFLHVSYILTLIPRGNRSRYSTDVSAVNYNGISEQEPITRHSVNRTYNSISGQAQHDAEVAEDDTNWFSKISFHWVQPLMLRGARGEINTVADMFQLPMRLNTYRLDIKFFNILEGTLKKMITAVETDANSGSNHLTGSLNFPEVEVKTHASTTCTDDTHSVSLLKALHRAFGVEYYAIGLLKLLADCFGFAGPVLLNLLVNYMESNTEPEKNGYIYAAGLFLSTLLGSLCSTQFDYNCQIVGFKMRTAIITTIYRKSLSVSGVSVTMFSSGQIINFMSTDTDRIVNFCPSFHNVWSLPFQIGVSLYLLHQQVGLAFLAGLAFAILLIPINRWLANKIGELSKAMMEQKDSRVKVMNEILFGIRVVKFYSWESHFKTKINSLRDLELKSLKGRKYLDAMCVYFWATTPVLISILTFTTYSLMGNQLTAAKVFTSLSLFLMLISPLNAFPWVLNGLMEAWVSLKRVQEFVALRDLDINQYYTTCKDGGSLIEVRDGEFAWQNVTSQEDGNTVTESTPLHSGDGVTHTLHLKDITLNIRQGQFVGVIGKVGSGKSSLLSAFLAEMCRVRGHIAIANMADGFALAAQEPWIQHATVRDNILFGRPFSSRKYSAVLEACALQEDLQVLPAGDKTEIGENGVTLSGGQKARVALARAVYQDKAVCLLDDPLAAVDAHVAQHLYQKCIMGLLKQKTRVLCTHHTKYLTSADLVIVMDDGRIVQAGPPEEVLSSIDLQFDKDEENGNVDNEESDAHDRFDSMVQDGSLVEEEEKETGVVQLQVYKAYWKAVGNCLAPMVLVALFMMQASRNINDWWLSYWVSHSNSAHHTDGGDNSQHNNQTFLMDYSPLQNNFRNRYGDNPGLSNATMENLTVASDNVVFFLTVYGCLAGANSIFTLVRAFLFAYGGICAAQVLHKHLLDTVLKAPVGFFDVTPIGRIVNRFSSDVFSIDDALPFILNIFLAQLYGILGTLVITCYGLPWFTLTLIPLGLLYYKIQQYYRHTSREIKRISSVTLSPIYAHFSETITGLTTIRAMRESQRFQSENLKRLDINQRAQFAARAAASWLGFRLQMLGVAIVTAIAFIAVLEHHFRTVDPGLVGLAISYALSVTNLLSGVVSSFTETEKQMVSVERAHQYIDNIPTERQDSILLPPPYWPLQGSISFRGVHLQYRDGLPDALAGVSFEVEPAEKVGIVGRTGSGKSSLFLALFRMVELQKGHIFIDGIDLHHLELKDIRSRLAIIPQDPFLFSGTIRENLDPTHMYTDAAVWSVLQTCHLRQAVERLGGLNGEAAERGRHFSVGQRQLICLARALLTRAKILCIDEATASVDLETDILIQQTIRSEFADSTVLTIAHRINTILDCDRVLVMHSGRVVEFSPPGVLLQDPSSLFYKLVHGNS